MAFPDARWGSETSWLREPLIRFSTTRVGSALIRRLAPVDRALLQRSRGRFTLLGPVAAPTLLLTTTGAKSGQPRTSPLLYGRDGDTLIVVGSNFGQDHHPAWTGNLLARSDAVVTMAGHDIPVHAELLAGAEAERGYQLMVDTVRTYAAYRNRTDRQIRVFRLSQRRGTDGPPT
jgi:deazaflavin-dependent oxidoreductase (nitroreductase family)